jgi:hypothetical protein
MPTRRPPASTVRPQTPVAQRLAGAIVGHRREPKPVFVDRSGKRRRILVVTGVAAAVVVVLALVSLVGGLFGGSPLPLPGLPDLVNPAPHPAPDTTIGDSASTGGPSAGGTGTASAPGQSISPSTQRHVPTQTPSDHGKPTKT